MQPVGFYSGLRRGRNEVLIWCVSTEQGCREGGERSGWVRWVFTGLQCWSEGFSRVKLGNLVDGEKGEPILVERDINSAARIIEAR